MFGKHGKLFGGRTSRQPARANGLRVESLEDRSVPAVLFPSNTTETVTDSGGQVLTNAHVELVFWGSRWNAPQGQALRSDFQRAVDRLLGSNYLSALRQYRATIGSASRVGTVTVSDLDPAVPGADIPTMLEHEIGLGQPPPPASDGQLLYFVLPFGGALPIGGADFGGADGVFGTHDAVVWNKTTFHYGAVRRVAPWTSSPDPSRTNSGRRSPTRTQTPASTAS
jgi:hypothetical protein